MRMNPPTLDKPKYWAYISAPISGTVDEGAEMFRLGDQLAKQNGWSTVLPPDIPPYSHRGSCPPARRGPGREHGDACYLRNDFQELLTCDAILLMPGWIGSYGCREEFGIAAASGLACFVAVQRAIDLEWCVIAL